MALSLFSKQAKPTSKASSAKKTESYSSSEISSGFLITMAFATLLALLFFASQSQIFSQTRKVRVLFNYIGGLEKNAPVHLAGHNVGKVSEIKFLGTSEAMVAVTLSIQKEAILHKDSEVFVDALGFMGEKYVEVTAGAPDSPLLGDNDPLRGTDPVAMMTMLKRAGDIAEQFERTGDAMEGLTKDLKDIVGTNKTELDSIFKNLDETSRNLKDMTADLKMHPWKLLRKTDDQKKRKKHFIVV